MALGNSNKLLGILICVLEEDDETKSFSSRESVPVFRSLGEKTLESLAAIVPHEDENIDFSVPLIERFDMYVSTWDDNELSKVIGFVKDWNSNSKNCFVSQLLLSSVIRVATMDRLMKIGSIAEAIPSLISYGERHYERLDKLQQASYVLEYMSSLMTLLPLEEPQVPKRKSRVDSSLLFTSGLVKDAAISDEGDSYDSDDADFAPSIFKTQKEVNNIKSSVQPLKKKIKL